MTARVEKLWGLATAAAANELRDRLVSAGAVALLIYMLGYCLVFLAQLSIALHLGADSYGAYAYVIAWVTVLAYVSALGFNVSLLRFLPVYAANRAWGLLAGLLRFAEQHVAGSGIALAVLGIAIVAWSSESLAAELPATFLFGLPIVPLFALLIVRCAAIRALGGVAASLAPNRVVREGFVLIVVLGAHLLGGPRVAAFVMLVTLMGTLLALAVATRLLQRLLPDEARAATRQFATETWWPATLPLLVVTGVEALFDKTGTLVLGLAGQSHEAGLFALAFNLALLVIVPRTAVETVFAPTIARLHAEGNQTEVRRVMIKASLLSFGGAVCVAGSLVVAAEFILARFGQEFVAAKLPLFVLLAGQVFAAASGSQLLVLSMTGNERRAAHILLVCASANVVLCAVLVWQMAAVGAAIATAMTIIAWNVLMAREIRHRLGLWPALVAVLFAQRRPAGRASADGNCATCGAPVAASASLSSLPPEEASYVDRPD